MAVSNPKGWSKSLHDAQSSGSGSRTRLEQFESLLRRRHFSPVLSWLQDSRDCLLLMFVERI